MKNPLSFPSARAVEHDGWVLSFSLDLTTPVSAETLLDIPGLLTLSIRFVGTDSELSKLDDRFGNYLRFPLPDGSCPVLEAALSDGKTPIGIPLGALEKPASVHRVTVRRATDAKWSIEVDGAVRDENGLRAPTIAWPANATVATISPRVSDLTVDSPAPTLPTPPDARPVSRPIQFWTPDDFNAWVGDVVVGVFRDRLHVFYLYDRRHHGSKEGTGGHFFAHLSSDDLVHWVEHPAAVPIDEWWQTCGTGTPFVWRDRLYLSYGLHTTRFMPAEETTEPAMQAYFREHGQMGVFAFGDLPGYPIGGTYAVSEDGIHFTRSNILFHTAQNPTVYNRVDGLLGCVNSYGGHHGIYVSDHPGDWRLEDPDIPIDGDCPCEFEWNGHHYLLQGFHHMAYNEDGRIGGWVDWSTTGDDVYDGLSVPMVAPWKNNRRIMAGWISHPCGWGGWLAFHELVQYPDGKLGVRWLPETQPPGPIWTYRQNAGESLRVRFPSMEGAAAVEFRLDASEHRAQWADAATDEPAPRQMTQAEWNASTNETVRKNGGLCPCGAWQYAVQNIRGLDAPFVVRLTACYDAKSGCTIFDAEIAGSRAMLCRRWGRFGKAHRIHEGP